jgi:tetratricopeptide (TPR) repeat protein
VAEARRFGDYELLTEIARGGMGVVYKARQISLNRVVALKMILAGQFASEREVERFYTEARAAAKLQHPHIVAIHEVGECDGQHYFSMDYIDGQSLSKLLRKNPLSPMRAAGYAKTIADAIEFAHRHRILHRDLKPANILIDAFDQPRVTDFGLAKQMGGAAQLTSTGAVMGTPSYMPPEQAGADGGNVGPASDVYSLGAILYESLTGRAPFVADSLIVTLNMVLNTEPVSPRLLNERVPRDLETICLKCLQKEPRNRYSTAAALAEDLGCFLRQEPVHARPVGDLERAWRLCRRNPVVTSLVAAVAAVLIAGTAISATFGIQANRAAARADEQKKEAVIAKEKAVRASGIAEQQRALALEKERQARVAEQIAKKETRRATLEETNAKEVSRFLANLFLSSHPLGVRGMGYTRTSEKGSELTAEQLLSRGKLEVEGNKQLPPLVKATLMADIGSALLSLGRYKEAEPLLQSALKLRQEHENDPDLPTNPADLATSFVDVGWLERDRGHYSEAERLLEHALAIQIRQTPRDALAVADTEFNLAWTFSDEDRTGEARALFEKVVDVRRKRLGPKDRRTQIAEIGLISATLAGGNDADALQAMVKGMDDADKADLVRAFLIYDQQERPQRAKKLYAQAESSYKRILELARKHAPSDHPGLALLLGDYAGLLREKGDYVDAEKSIREALQIAERSLGSNHPKLVEPMRLFAFELAARGAFDEAVVLLKRALTSCDRHPIREDENREHILRQLVKAYREEGDYVAAEHSARLGIELAERRWNAGAGVRDMSADLCVVLRERGKFDEACARLRKHLSRIRDNGARDERLARLRDLCDCLRDAGRYREAREVDRQAHDLFDEGWTRGEFSFSAIPFRTADEYVKVQKGLLDAARHSQPYRSDPDPLRFVGDRLEPYAEQLLAVHRLAAAESVFREAVDLRTKTFRGDHVTTCRALRGLAESLLCQGHGSEAASVLRKVLSLTLQSYGDPHINVANAEIDLARCLLQQGKKEDAEKIARSAQSRAEQALGPGHAWLPLVYRRIAHLLDECGRSEDSEALLHEGWTLDRNRFPANHPRLMDSGLLYAQSLAARSRFSEAEALLHEILGRYQKELPARSWRMALVSLRLGSILTARKQFEESERLLTEANGTLALAFGQSDSRVTESRGQLVRLYEAWGKPEKAAHFHLQ